MKIESIEKQIYFDVTLKEETENDDFCHHYRRTYDGNWFVWEYINDVNEYSAIPYGNNSLANILEELFIKYISEKGVD